jgi:nitrite reductase (NO-forming)
MPRRLLALLAVAVIAAAGCGDSSDEGDGGAAEDGGGAGLEVKATDFAFTPTTLDVEPGAEVEVSFVNGGNVAHTFTAEELDVDVEADSGQTETVTFTAPDEDASIEFVCRFHSGQMTGTIAVGAGGDAGSGGSSEKDSEDSGGYDY